MSNALPSCPMSLVSGPKSEILSSDSSSRRDG
jgi:hypothetical protein